MATLPDEVTNSLRQRVADLEQIIKAISAERDEALAQQLATTDVFQVINSSPASLVPVFNAILESAMRLCEAPIGVLWTYDGEYMRASASRGAPPAYAKFLEHGPIRPSHIQLQLLGNSAGFVQVADLTLTEGYRVGDPLPRAAADLGGIRTLLVVSLRKRGILLGTFGIYRQEVRPFSDRQVTVVQSFAGQAVIAMENARLFKELQTRTFELSEALEQQTATADVLQVISSSAGDLGSVFDALLGKAMQLCGANFGVLNTYDRETFTTAATYGLPSAYAKYRGNRPLQYAPDTAPARLLRGEPFVEIIDLLNSEAYQNGEPSRRALVDLGGARCLLAVPLVKNSQVVGNIMIFRQENRRFSDKQIALLQQFAAQAVIAIENTRLLRELRQRTDDLTKSLDNLRTAQDRLVQTEKLASLGQLTAGIAHEIKNPLNFVNNFAALSAELVDEMNDLFENAAVDEPDKRRELVEIQEILKRNLEKIVEHGKRADSIVKNMLLHSREGSGEQRAVDVNALLDESLNLAYHGARAEKPGFNITLQRDFDPVAGTADVYPQEISRVLLNLISNGFYAASRRAAEAGDGFEPVLRAATKNLGDKTEIRIRDNGTGIASEVKEKIFNPFFTTKPAGEGTGLGLSMSHDIVVKQHGGTINVDTEPGVFTEFIVTLPRTRVA